MWTNFGTRNWDPISTLLGLSVGNLKIMFLVTAGTKSPQDVSLAEKKLDGVMRQFQWEAEIYFAIEI